MTSTVGQKGQVVIAKEIRDRLGVKPGWQALQLLVGDHVEIYFVPPPHNQSLAGSLASYVQSGGSLEDHERWEESVRRSIVGEFVASAEREGDSQ